MKRIEWKFVAIVLGFIFLFGIAMVGMLSKDQVQEPKPRECVDYTLREYRAGDAPQKCQAEVYGDQF